MESLYSKITAETENYFSATLDKNTWDNLNAGEQNALREVIVKHFTEEKTEVWAAGALALGRLAAFDRRSEDLLQEYMITATNIHCLRHAFTAMGSYAAHIDEERPFVFLDRYRNIPRKEDFNLNSLVKKIQEKWGTDNWETCFESVGLRGALTAALDKKDVAKAVGDYFASLGKGNKINVVAASAKSTIAEVVGGLSERQLLEDNPNESLEKVVTWSSTVAAWWNQDPLGSVLKNRTEALNRNPNPGLEKSVEKLKELQDRIKNGPSPSFDEVLKATGTSIEKIFAWKSRQVALSIEDLDEWVVGSFVFAFPLSDQIVGRNFDPEPALRYLLLRGEKQIAYVKNVPYVIGWQEADVAKWVDMAEELQEADGTKWVDMAEKLIEAVQGNRIQHDSLHLAEFLVDVAYLIERLPEDSKYKHVDLFDLVEKAALVPPDYTKRVRDIRGGIAKPPARETASLVRQIMETFTPDQEWREQTQEVRNLPLLLQLILDGQLAREDRDYEYVLSEERKDRLLIDALKARIDDNPELSAILIRMLKDRFYRRLEEIVASPVSTDEAKKQLEAECLRQFHTVFDILSGWNWRVTIYKDAATILVRLLEKSFEVGHQELAQKLFYLLFYQYPETPILQTMRAYTSKDSELRKLLDSVIFLLKKFRKAEKSECQLGDESFNKLWERYLNSVAIVLWPDDEGQDNERQDNERQDNKRQALIGLLNQRSRWIRVPSRRC